MDRRQFLTTAGLSLAVPVAGCSAPAGETPGGQRVAVTFTNESEQLFVFTAAVVEEGFGGVRLTRPDGAEETFPDAETVDDVPTEAWDRAVTFTPLGEHQRREFRASGGAGISAEFAPTPYDSTVVTALAAPSADPPMRGVGAGGCGDATDALIEVRVGADGAVHQSTTCEDAGTPS